MGDQTNTSEANSLPRTAASTRSSSSETAGFRTLESTLHGYQDGSHGGDPAVPALPAPLPTEKLRDAVDLIVVPAVGKGEQLIEKLAQPGRVPGKDDSSRLEIRQLSLGARQLVALRLNADGSRHTRVAVVAQLLNQVQPRPRLFDQDRVYALSQGPLPAVMFGTAPMFISPFSTGQSFRLRPVSFSARRSRPRCRSVPIPLRPHRKPNAPRRRRCASPSSHG